MPRPEPETATVLLDGSRLIGSVDRRIFGGFLEHLGRAVYGGVFDPTSALADERGFRRDVITAVRRMGMSAIRYPGGNFASAYDWRDGVGEHRPVRREPAWEQTEPNTFGTDEFLAWCAAANVEPIITANLGTGTPSDAAEWVRHCAEQASNGLPRASLWCLGNEMDGPWQIGHTTAEDYAAKAREASRRMREVDAGLTLLAAGSSGDFLPTYMQWDRTVLEACWEDVDLLGIHRYSHNRDGDSAWYLAEGVAVDGMIDEFARLLREMGARKRSTHTVRLAIDEWNVWYRAKGPQHERGGWRTGAPLLQEGYNLEDALVVGQYLASFIRHADVVKLACLAQVVNAIAPIITTPTGLLKQTIYWPFALFARHALPTAAEARVEGPAYDAGARGRVPLLDGAATTDAAGRWAVFLTNRSLDAPLYAKLAWRNEAPSKRGEAWRLAGGDPREANTFAEPARVVPHEIEAPPINGVAAELSLPPLSLTVLTFG